MSPMILYVDNLVVSFNGFRAVNDLNLYLGYGELRFLIGPNGAGKTTLLDVLCGKVKPESGTISFRDKIIVNRLQEHELVRAGISRKFQSPSIFNEFTVEENLDLAVRRNKAVFPIMFGRGKEPAARREAIREALEEVWLAEQTYRLAGTLSHGEKQRLEIAMLLVQKPELLLLDEPVAGLTSHEKEKMGELLQKIAEKHTCLVVEHDMKFVRRFAQRVTVMHEGRVLAEGDMAHIQSDPRVIEVYLGREGAMAC